MANIEIQVTLLTTGGGSGPLYDGYYTTDGTNYILAASGLSLPTVGSYVSLMVPSNTTNFKLINTNTACGSTSSTTPVVTTTTTTTTASPASVNITTYNGLPGSSFTVYINGNADTTWKSGTRSYPVGTSIYINYTSPACGTVLNSIPYSSGTLLVISTGGASYTFEIYNSDYWITTGYTCYGNLQYTQQVNLCGGYREIRTNPGSTCDCYCNQTCAGTYYGLSVCGGGVGLGNSLIQYEYWVCSGNPTGNYQIVDNCSCQCNIGCAGFSYSSPYCGAPGRYGTNTSALYQDKYFNCTGGYAGTDTISGCSCSCNQTCAGTYWEPYCTNYGVYPYERRQRQRYNCNGALTGLDELISTCNTNCGANTSAIWETTASYCLGSPHCNLWVDQRQTNQCCTSPPYGSTRFISLGPNSYCYYTYPVDHCIGNDLWRYDFNPCTDEISNDHLVQSCSPSCGGDYSTYYELSGCSGGYAFTKIAPDGYGQRYVLPYPTETFYTYTGASSGQCTPPPGYNGSIQKTNDYYCP